jgi:hypothetical protein
MEEAMVSGAPAQKPQEREPRQRVKREQEPPESAAVKASLKKWTEFTERCASAELVAFDVDDGFFKVSALASGVLYTYVEEIPDMEIRYKKVDEKVHIDSIDISSASLVPAALRGRLDCGLGLYRKESEVELPDESSVYKVVYTIDPGTAKSWIAYQLAIDEDSIVQGELRI